MTEMLRFGIVLFLAWTQLPAARADTITDWNRVAMSSVGTLGVGTGWQSRVMAITHAAMFDAVNGIDPRYQHYALSRKPRSEASIDAAASAAAYAVLCAFVPNDHQRLDRAYDEAMAKVPDGLAKQEGIAQGRAVAEHLVRLRLSDGAQGAVNYVPGTGLGAWQPTPPDRTAANVPHFGRVVPFTLSSVEQFSLPGQPALDSAVYARDLLEVRSKGARRESTRTADESEAAIFWNVLTSIPFNNAVRALSVDRKFNVIDNARLFALVHMVGADSQIATWYWKYRQNFWRPITAIRLSESDWDSLIGSPNHPEYPSGHAAYSGAVVALLKALVGDAPMKIELFNPFSGLTRGYANYSAIGREVINARVWGGIHFRTSDEHADELGRKIGEHAAANVLKPLK
jgi:PAP2 superfamily